LGLRWIVIVRVCVFTIGAEVAGAAATGCVCRRTLYPTSPETSAPVSPPATAMAERLFTSTSSIV
jgi:hypothetical protein